MIIARQTTQANYDRLSRWYDFLSGSSERPARMQGLHMLAVQPGEHLLEIGCGTGESLPMLASSTGKVGGVVELDLSLGMLNVAKRKLKRQSIPNINFTQSDGTRLPFGNGAFHAIFMSFTLELFPEMEISSLLRECRRALRPGGRIGVVSLLQKDEPGWMENAYNWAHYCWPDIIDCRPIPLNSLLERSGFTLREMAERSMWGLSVGIAVVQ
jgi:ubiquinone/menaquinone biosynthesis C-methylase UbiE